jgi:hypothetical protein
MAKTISFRSFSSRGDLSLAANSAVAISPLSSCEIAIGLPGFKLLKAEPLKPKIKLKTFNAETLKSVAEEVASYTRSVTDMLISC